MANVLRSTAFVLAVAGSLIAFGGASAQELPPGPNFTVQSMFEGQAVTGAYEIVQLVLDFPPGAWTPSHSHGGQVFVTVLSGNITVRGDAGERVFRPGDTWREMPGDRHVAGNATGETARVLSTFLLPEGASLTTVANAAGTDALPPGPVLVYQTRTAGPALSGALDVVQLQADFAPGAWTPNHEHGGRGVVTVTEGSIRVKDASGEKSYGPGESWIEGQGEVAAVGNSQAQMGRLVGSFVLTKGAKLTTVREPTGVMPTSLPATGGSDSLPYLALLAGAAALVIGLRLRQRGAAPPTRSA